MPLRRSPPADANTGRDDLREALAPRGSDRSLLCPAAVRPCRLMREHTLTHTITPISRWMKDDIRTLILQPWSPQQDGEPPSRRTAPPPPPVLACVKLL